MVVGMILLVDLFGFRGDAMVFHKCRFNVFQTLVQKVGKAASSFLRWAVGGDSPPFSPHNSPSPLPAHTCWLHVDLWGADCRNNPISELMFQNISPIFVGGTDIF